MDGAVPRARDRKNELDKDSQSVFSLPLLCLAWVEDGGFVTAAERVKQWGTSGIYVLCSGIHKDHVKTRGML